MPALYPASNDSAHSLWRKMLTNPGGTYSPSSGEPEHSYMKKLLRNQEGTQGANSMDSETMTLRKMLRNQAEFLISLCGATAPEYPNSSDNENRLVAKILINQNGALPYINAMKTVPILKRILTNQADAVTAAAGDLSTLENIQKVIGPCAGSGPGPSPIVPRHSGVNLFDGLIAHWGNNPLAPTRTYARTSTDLWKDEKANIYDLSENGTKIWFNTSSGIVSNYISSSTSNTYGHTDYLEQTETLWRFGSGDFTVSLYAQYKAIAATPRAGVIACSGGVGERSWSLAYDEVSSRFIFSVSTDGTNWTHVATSGVAAARNVWHRITFGRNGTNIWISVNQEVKVETAIGTDALSNTGHLIVFQEDSLRTAASFFGYIDEISIWDSALNDDEVAAFGNGSAVFGLWKYTSLLSPSNGGRGTGRRSLTPSTPITVFKPAAGPNGQGLWEEDDILIVAASAPNPVMGTWTMDGTWNLLFDEQYPADSLQIAAWWKRAGPAEADPLISLSTASGGYVVQMGCIRGAIASGSPFRESFLGSRVAPQTDIDTLAYTPTSDNDYALHLVFANDNLVFSNTEPLTPMFLDWAEPSTAGADSTIFWARKVLPSVGGVLVPSENLGAITGVEAQFPKVLILKT